jgi:hypothetical protein
MTTVIATNMNGRHNRTITLRDKIECRVGKKTVERQGSNEEADTIHGDERK